MTLGKPKNWGELLALLSVLAMFIGLITLAQDTNRIARENQITLKDREGLIEDFNQTFYAINESFRDIRDILDDIQDKQDDNLIEIIMINEKEGFILQRLPEKHGAKTITIPFSKYPPEMK